MKKYHAKQKPTREEFIASVDLVFGKKIDKDGKIKSVARMVDLLGLQVETAPVDFDTGEVYNNKIEVVPTKEVIAILQNSEKQKTMPVQSKTTKTPAAKKTSANPRDKYTRAVEASGDIYKFDSDNDFIECRDLQKATVDFRDGKGEQETFLITEPDGTVHMMPTNLELLKKLRALHAVYKTGIEFCIEFLGLEPIDGTKKSIARFDVRVSEGDGNGDDLPF